MPLATILKVGPYVVIIALLGWIGWLKYDIANRDTAEAKAVIEFKNKAEALANELIIQQAIAMGTTEKTTVTYIDRIRNVRVPPDEEQACTICARGERSRLGTTGVRDILHGTTPAGP